MKERPMKFNAPMVRGVLEDRNTMTRRIVKPQPEITRDVFPTSAETMRADGSSTNFVFKITQRQGVYRCLGSQNFADEFCPYGQPGDRLWVREAFRFPASLDKRSPAEVGAMAVDAGYKEPWCPTQYEADAARNLGWAGFETPPVVSVPGRLRQNRHMPHWASRILLEIVSVRVERLQDISEEDARAEGIEDGGCTNCGNHEPCGCDHPSPDARDSFIFLWNQIYGPGAWDKNPWVWVVEFKRIDAAH